MKKTLFTILLILLIGTVLYAQPIYETRPRVSDEAYNATTWDGVRSVAPSKNAVRDKIETLAPSTGSTSIVSYGPTALQSASCTANTLTLTPTAGLGIVNISVTQTGDANCAITMGETGAVEGTVAIIKNISDGAAETLTFTTSSNVLRLIQGSPFAMGINETLILQYKGSEWLEIGRASTTIKIRDFNLSIQAGDGTYSGLTINYTAGETLAFGQPVYVKSDGKVWKADADGAATMPAVGLVVVGGNADATVTILVHGYITETDWNWTIGNTIYVADGDAGAITATLADISDENDVVQIIGIAVHADSIYVSPSLATVVLAAP